MTCYFRLSELYSLTSSSQRLRPHTQVLKTESLSCHERSCQALLQSAFFHLSSLCQRARAIIHSGTWKGKNEEGEGWGGDKNTHHQEEEDEVDNWILSPLSWADNPLSPESTNGRRVFVLAEGRQAARSSPLFVVVLLTREARQEGGREDSHINKARGSAQTYYSPVIWNEAVERVWSLEYHVLIYYLSASYTQIRWVNLYGKLMIIMIQGERVGWMWNL